MKTRFPLYIPSKGRSDYMITSKVLTKMGVHHTVVVEPHEVEKYEASVKSMSLDAEVLVLDMSYKAKYETCDNLGLTKSTGPGPARNFIWDHSISKGHEWHWVMDDNIREFFRFHENRQTAVRSPVLFSAMENFATRYKNVAMAGPQYYMFAPRKVKVPPFVINTRIYSCNFIRNSTPFRWRGRYNEDTILSLDMLTAGWCTIQFNAYLQQKLETQAIPGGNTAEFYHAEGKVVEGQKYATGGTSAKSQMLVDVYPQYARLKWKWQRVHHHVDYLPFKHNKLIIDEQNAKANTHGFKLIVKSKQGE